MQKLESTNSVDASHYCELLKRAKTPFVLRELVQRISHHRIKPTDYLTATLMSAYDRVGQTKEALDTFYDARKQDVHLLPSTYAAALALLVKSGQHTMARELLETMQRESIEINIFTYNRFIDALAKTGLFSEAIAAVQVKSYPSVCHCSHDV